jgi:hypothetical protein
MSVLSEETTGASLATDAGLRSIAAATSRVEYTGPLQPDNPEGGRLDRSLATQWIRQLVACHATGNPGSLAHPITPDTLIPVMYWSTLSTYLNGTEHIDLVPLWMLAAGEMVFLRANLSTPPDDAELATTLLGSEQAPYRWHMKIFWGNEQSAETFSEHSRKQLADAVPPDVLAVLAGFDDGLLKSPTAQTRALVGGKKVHVHALLLGGSLGDGGPHGSGSVASIEGVLILSDRQRPEIDGTVGVYFPDSPDGNDFHEFSDLSDGIARLLLRDEWYGYFRSRISLVEPDEIKRILGRRGGRPFVGVSFIDGDFLEVLYRAHVSFRRAHAAERSTSNWEVTVTFSDILPQIIGGVLDVLSLLLFPGFELIKRAMTVGWAMFRTGLIPVNVRGVLLLYLLESTRGRELARRVAVLSRGQTSFLAVTAGHSQREARLGLPLEEAVYRGCWRTT